MTTTILVIEDNPITRKLVRVALEAQKFVVIDAPDAGSATALFRANPISLVLMDLILPDGDGFELLTTIRALPNGSDVPILAFSGMLTTLDEARVSQVGFDDVVTKPVEPSRLIHVIRAHLPPQPGDAVAQRPAKQLLIADDDAVQRKLVALRLQRAGFKVAMAADGQEALERARLLKPDAIVSDVLMPRLDGFGLCMAVRNDPELAATPVLLVTNSYLDAEDRALAKRAGATDLIFRTPELKEVLVALDDTIAHVQARSVAVAVDPEVERERVRRVMAQLERQVAINAGVNQRCALLSAELSVLSGISSAVATHRDLESALHQVLATCFDAGGISLGILYISDKDRLRVFRYGAAEAWGQHEVESFFGRPELLRSAISNQLLMTLAPTDDTGGTSNHVLTAAKVKSMVIAPLGHMSQALGALVVASRSNDLENADRVSFAQAVAGQISLALALARAFAEKDASEHAASSNAAVLRSILESMGEGVLVSNKDGKITHFNRAALNALGNAPGKTEPSLDIGTYRTDQTTLLVPGDFPLSRAIRGESVDGVEIFVRRTGASDGLWLAVNARPLDGGGGGVAVFRDVTAEKNARAQLLVSDRMASLGTLAAGVGHEINNPLMAVLGNLEMASADLQALVDQHKGSIDFGELPDELRDAHEAAQRVRNIVRDLKLFSRSDDEARGEVDVERVLESSIRMVWNEIRHRAQLVRNYQPIPAVYANDSRLGQVFLNLIVNAAQAIPEGRANQNEIRVTTLLAPDGRVKIEISDTGHGMSPETLKRIFTPFFTTKPIGVGTGLGLAICHQLVTAIGGEILVTSELGKGTQFQLLLPPSGGGLVSLPSPESGAPVAKHRGRILVIDDETIVASTIRRALGPEHEVVGLSDAHEAAERIANGEQFDVILCDLMMPTVTGMDFYEAITKVAPALAQRIIFITGGAFTSQARSFLDKIPNARLDKPFEIQQLRDLINERLRSR